MKKRYFLVLGLFFATFFMHANEGKVARKVVERSFGQEVAEVFVFEFDKELLGHDAYKIVKNDKNEDKIIVASNSTIGMCRGAYDFLKNYSDGIYNWSGTSVNLEKLKNLGKAELEGESPFLYRYYFNVVTHGYSTAYWTWERWEKELDWMAMHGVNMPLLPGAYEAIAYKTFVELGISADKAKAFFTGPAFFPWNRMGNISAWDNDFPLSYFDKQIELTHKILDRLKDLGMTPIIQAFAGFVPEEITDLYDVKLTHLDWAGFPKENLANLILPSTKENQELFVKIGNMYVANWKKEFGTNKYYLSDTFNEMDVPLSSNSQKALLQMKEYGETIYKSISLASSEAVWVMQGWTFPYYLNAQGQRVWTSERLESFVSSIPDDKVMFLDLANDYNAHFWHIPASWETYKGFLNKPWIYSTIPNMGGKVSYIGILDFYANSVAEILSYNEKANLIGYGSAPEGIENNEIVYELIFDAAWQKDAIDLDVWLESYCKQKYNYSEGVMKEAMSLLKASCFGHFTDHPRFDFQFRPSRFRRGTAHKSNEFFQAVKKFAEASNFTNTKMYEYDLIELSAQYLGLVADNLIAKANRKVGKKRLEAFEEVYSLLVQIDSLLEGHPNLKLENWVGYARSWGNNDNEKAYYESNAKRLITTWGGPMLSEYSARLWAGLVKDYYATRWLENAHAKRNSKKFALYDWEENWINTPWNNTSEPFSNPVEKAKELIHQYKEFAY